MTSLHLQLSFGFVLVGAACAAGSTNPSTTTNSSSSSSVGGSEGGGGGVGGSGSSDAVVSAGVGGGGGMETCTSVTEEAELVVLPVDIIWVVDNSNSMEPSIAQVKQGLNDFANLISASSLDYKVILLSKRGTTDLSLCIPEPLAGDANCGNGPRFFHSNVDILSTQPLEQFLGTLGQTNGYTPGTQRGGDPWASELRPEATKTIVVVTDDNARLSATDFRTFAGGQNPFNSLTLPPGILDASWNGLFDGFLFSGIYGWGNAQDPSVTCTYSGGATPPSSGPTYTTLVQSTGGVRAQLCDGAAAWAPFFDQVAQAVVDNAVVACNLDIPPPPPGEQLDFNLVNVALNSGNAQTVLPQVAGLSACGDDPGWYYDDPAAPSQVILCPASCAAAQDLAGPGKDGSVEVLFGCATVIE